MNDAISFRNTSSANGAVVLYYNWNFGDPGTNADTSILRNPTYKYSSVAIYNAQLVVMNELGCNDTV
jgi:PKD repeat protein